MIKDQATALYDIMNAKVRVNMERSNRIMAEVKYKIKKNTEDAIRLKLEEQARLAMKERMKNMKLPVAKSVAIFKPPQSTR